MNSPSTPPVPPSAPVPPDHSNGPPARRVSWRSRIHEVIFEADTGSGKFFDVALLVAIFVSVLIVTLDSVPDLNARFHRAFIVAEWAFTILFTIEYILRLLSVRRPLRYALSFYGVIDFLAIVPTYLSLFIVGAQSLLVIRALRLLRVFRVFKLARFLTEASDLQRAIWASRPKVFVFLTAVLIVVTIMGAAMHVVEGRENDAFSTIPHSMYWAIVTMTTVGYGDITPVTPLGKGLAAVIMVLGYSFIIVPTGIISAELAAQVTQPVSTQACPTCSREGHDIDATFCKHCGAAMADAAPPTAL